MVTPSCTSKAAAKEAGYIMDGLCKLKALEAVVAKAGRERRLVGHGMARVVIGTIRLGPKPSLALRPLHGPRG